MNLIELIQRGGERVKSQGLAQSFLGMQQMKHDAKVTFATEKELAQGLAKQACGVREPEYVGVVPWIPKDAFAASNGGAA